jgi:hypothetical protein
MGSIWLASGFGRPLSPPPPWPLLAISSEELGPLLGLTAEGLEGVWVDGPAFAAEGP